jgi:hypothetical protein
LLSRGLRAASDSITIACALRLWPAIFVLEIAALYGMETVEQSVVYGHALGGALWLGAPVVASLSIHASFCLCATILAARSLRTVARAVVRIVHLLRAFTILPAQGASPLRKAVDALVAAHVPAPIPCRIGKRAPPLLIPRSS